MEIFFLQILVWTTMILAKSNNDILDNCVKTLLVYAVLSAKTVFSKVNIYSTKFVRKHQKKKAFQHTIALICPRPSQSAGTPV
jgi:hypothetical protein